MNNTRTEIFDFLRNLIRESEELVSNENRATRENIIQASEKLYKVVEDCIKLLAERYNIRPKKGWSYTKLARTAQTLIQRVPGQFSELIANAWDADDLLSALKGEVSAR